MRNKPFYIWRIFDNIFIIYKLSNYSAYHFKEVKAGLVYDSNMSNYSKAFKSALKKYDLSQDLNTGSLAETKERFYIDLYLNHKDKLPSKCLKTCKVIFDRYMNEEIKKHNDLS